MKKGIMLTLCFLMTLILSLTGCSMKSSTTSTNEDSVRMATFVEEWLIEHNNPTFMCITDAVCEHERVCNLYKRDSVFRTLNEQTIANVSSVIIRQHNLCTIQDIVDEYLEHENIYKNLEPQNTNYRENDQPEEIDQDSICNPL